MPSQKAHCLVHILTEACQLSFQVRQPRKAEITINVATVVRFDQVQVEVAGAKKHTCK